MYLNVLTQGAMTSSYDSGRRQMTVTPVSPGGGGAGSGGGALGPVGAPILSSSAHHHGLNGLNILTVDMFSKEQLNAIFNLAQTFRLCVQKERSLDHILKVHFHSTSGPKKKKLSFIANGFVSVS